VIANLWESSLGEDTVEVHVSFPFHLLFSVSMPVDNVGWIESVRTYIKRQVLPQAPSPTITSLRRISAIFNLDQRTDSVRERIKNQTGSKSICFDTLEQVVY
jgi:hypothetical protein